MGDPVGARRPWRIWIAGAIAAVGVSTSAWGCAMISGLSSLSEAASTDDGGSVMDVGDSGVISGPGTSDCTPDPNFCNTHCGNANDNCGQPRACSTDCGQNNVCDPTTHTCGCAVDPNFCDSRCGSATDNCTHPIDCGGCDGGLTCTAGGACGCDPETLSAACGTRKCGQTTNNCKQTVFCGAGGTGSCATTGDFCEANGTCCTPNNGAACAGTCNTTATNNCGQTVSCPSTCPTGQVCDGTSCCTPQNYCVNGNECGTGLNNCGQTISCGSCFQVCGGSGTCNAGFCTCTCGCNCLQSATSGLHLECVTP